MSALRSMADLFRTLETDTYLTTELYERAEAAGLADLPGGRKKIHGGPEQWMRRLRSQLQHDRARGLAEHRGRAAWLIHGTREVPRKAVLVWLTGELSQVELALAEAAEFLRRCDEPVDLVLADPPWGLGRSSEEEMVNGYGRTYRRRGDLVVPGYVEVDPARYADFTAEWIAAAVEAIRPGGYLAIVTGPEQAARVQVPAEDAGLTYVNSIKTRTRGLPTTRRFAHTHNVTTLMTRGKVDSRRRVFNPPADMALGRNGGLYLTDLWTDIPFHQRAGLLRYDNMLSPVQVSRIVLSTTDEGHLVADPFLGGGTTAEVCVLHNRRFTGADLNPYSLQFTIGRVQRETLPRLAHGIQLDLFGGNR